jgi:hypothetical protein
MAKTGDRLPIVAQAKLSFAAAPVGSKPAAPGAHTMADNLSAAAFIGGALFVGGDEEDLIAVLNADGPDFIEQEADDRIAVYDRVKPLKKGIDADGGTIAVKREIDIEGLAFEDGALWVAGSHAWRRRRIPRGTDPAEALETIAKGVQPQLGRCLLARLSMDGGKDRRLKAHRRHGDILSAAVAAHPVLGPFTIHSSKENGLDIEGLAVRKRRVFLGCRGPVVGGFAVVLDIKLAEDGDELDFADPDKALAVHYLRLDGFGIRDLHRAGEDLLILTGPTMEEPGAATIWRWRDAFATRRIDNVIADPQEPGSPIVRIGEIEGSGPMGKPEAIVALPETPQRLLVLRDGAAKTRRGSRVTVTADIVAIGG